MWFFYGKIKKGDVGNGFYVTTINASECIMFSADLKEYAFSKVMIKHCKPLTQKQVDTIPRSIFNFVEKNIYLLYYTEIIEEGHPLFRPLPLELQNV